MKTRVCVWFAVHGVDPNGQTMLHGSRIIAGNGPWQNDVEHELQRTNVAQLLADGVLDEVTACGMAPSREAWLYNGQGSDGEGVTAVLVEVTL